MTTGSRLTDRTWQIPSLTGTGTLTVGQTISKVWQGYDSISAQKPRSTYPLHDTVPPRRVKLSPEQREALRTSWAAIKAVKATKRRVDKIRKRQQKRLLPPNPYTMAVSDRVRGYLVLQDRRAPKSPPGAFEPRDPWGGSPPTYDPSNDYKVIEKLRRKAYGSGFNPAVFTAEGRQAFNMITSTSTMLRLGIGSLIRADWRGVAAAWSIEPSNRLRKVVTDPRRSLSNKWLELQYGWRPLVSDMEDAAQWLASAVNGSAHYGNSITARRDFAVFEEKAIGQYDAVAWRKRLTIFSVQYKIYAVRKSPVFLPSLATVASVAWEKLPWSFVADWVVPIGSYISACRTASDLKGTVVKTVTSRTFNTEYGIGQHYILSGMLTPAGGPSYKYTKCVRTVSSELQPPTPLGGIATDLTFLSWKRAANAVALLAQRKWSSAALPI